MGRSGRPNAHIRAARPAHSRHVLPPERCRQPVQGGRGVYARAEPPLLRRHRSAARQGLRPGAGSPSGELRHPEPPHRAVRLRAGGHRALRRNQRFPADRTNRRPLAGAVAPGARGVGARARAGRIRRLRPRLHRPAADEAGGRRHRLRRRPAARPARARRRGAAARPSRAGRRTAVHGSDARGRDGRAGRPARGHRDADRPRRRGADLRRRSG